MYECAVCKKYSMQGGSCHGGIRNCLYFDKEPRGRVLQETFLIDYGWNPSALVKRGEKLETKDGMELTVVTVEWVDFSARQICVVARYHESEKPPEDRRKEFIVLQGGNAEEKNGGNQHEIYRKDSNGGGVPI